MATFKYGSDDANSYKEVAVCGGTMCEFYDCRVDQSTVPEGKYMYQLRGSDDDGGGTPATLENSVAVNFFGTIISDVKLIPDGKEYLTLNDTRCYIFHGVDPEYITPADVEYPAYAKTDDGWKFTDLGRFEDLASDMGLTYIVDRVCDEETDSQQIVMRVNKTIEDGDHESKDCIKIQFDSKSGQFIRIE